VASPQLCVWPEMSSLPGKRHCCATRTSYTLLEIVASPRNYASSNLW
jgi:hypothetical protein